MCSPDCICRITQAISGITFKTDDIIMNKLTIILLNTKNNLYLYLP